MNHKGTKDTKKKCVLVVVCFFMGSFFYTYSLMQIPGGWLNEFGAGDLLRIVSRMGARRGVPFPIRSP